MMQVRDSFFPQVRCFADPGSPKKDVFQPVKDKGDARILKKVGETDLYEIIQSFKDECSIKRIIERYENGDVSALQRVQALYFDSTGLPCSLDEAYDQVNRLHSLFESLTPEAKEFYKTMPGFVEGVLNGDFPQSAIVDDQKGVDVNG